MFAALAKNFARGVSHTRHLSSSPSHIAVIGVGQIGMGVLQGIERQIPDAKVTAYDVSEKNRGVAEEAGASWSKDATSAVEGADVVVTALPTPMHVQKLMEGKSDVSRYGHFVDDGSPGEALFHQAGVLASDCLWVDHTTVSPAMARRFSEASSERAIGYVEAPLTGGWALLMRGQMTVYLGGSPDAVARAMPVVTAYSGNQVVMGEAGTAAVVKVISNQLAGAHQLLAAESAALARAHGVDLEAFLHGIRLSAGNSYALETELPLMFNGSFQPGFELGLHVKDLEIAQGLAEQAGWSEEAALPLLALTRKYYEEGVDNYGVLAGSTAPSRLVEERTGVSLAVDGYEQWTYEVEAVASTDPRNGPDGMAVVHHGVKGSPRQ